jgi:hypothetical protein
VDLHGPFGPAKTSPREQAQAEGDGRAVPGEERVFEPTAMPRRECPATALECGQEGIVQRRGPPLVGFSERGALGRRQAEGGERCRLRGPAMDHIP